ncbi:MAG: S41 family peptidase [Dehalococcoidia bacterium]|nr:S41 family peptidase [Dehalococcoidia bacterium]
MEDRMTHRSKSLVFLSALLLILAVVISCRSAQAPAAQPAAVSPATPSSVSRPGAQVPSEPLKPVWFAWNILKSGYVDKSKLDPQVMSQAAVKSVVNRLGSEAPKLIDPPQANAKPPKEMPKEMRPLWDGWAAVYEGYRGGKPLDDVKLGQQAVSAFLASLNDPHTEYIPPEQYKSFSQDFDGQFGGIGAEVTKRNEKVLLNPMPESPAEEAGLKAGDTLVAVDGDPVDGWSVLQVVNRVRGKKGTEVALTLVHFGSMDNITLRVVRDTIQLKSVFWNMTNEQYAYVRLSFFYANTPQAMEQALKEIAAQGAKGIILDLRNNPGGFLRATVDVASHFVHDGLVLYEVDGSGKRTDWKAVNNGLPVNLPMVVLVNQFTASGSEVLTGALQDYGRAKVVGVTTFGKGSVNLFSELPDGGGLYYTVARWFTPNGRLIERKGLDPDFVVVASGGGRGGDSQLDKGLELLRQEVNASTTSR